MPYRRLESSRYVLFLLVVTAGCVPEPQVETYTLTRAEPARPVLDAQAFRKQLDQILVAILPEGDKAWFFKLVGKAPAIERQRGAFLAFLETVKSPKNSGANPTWQLPPGWQEGKPSAMRDATLLVPDESGQLELAVSSLPLSGNWEDFLVPNVNRWLGQLDRRALSRKSILDLAQPAQTKSGAATVFQLSGAMTQRPMGGNPHAGLGMASPQSQVPSATVQSGELTYETPLGWLPGKMSMMRKAAFQLPGGGMADEVTVTSFPGGPGSQMADVTANVQRWAGQVGAQVSADSLDEITDSITVDGHQGTYVELDSPSEVSRPMALHVAMVEREGQVWFFKMSGESELVRSQRKEFRDFLASVKFP